MLFTEDLAIQPEIVLDSIMGFLGLEGTYRPKNLGEQYHQSGERVRFRRLAGVLARKALFRRLWHLLPERAKTEVWWWFKDKFGSVRGQAPKMGNETRTLLEEFYRRDVADLERLIDRRVPWPEFSASGTPPQV